jgi:hypothetical protein
MEIFGNNIKQILSKKFCCKKCDYSTERKSNFDNHIKSNKHKKEINGNIFKQELSNLFICKDCDKVYQTNAGLWKHKNKNNCCNKTNEQDVIENPLSDNTEKDELIHYLMNESKELKNLILEVLKNGTSNTNNISNINSHNKTFNLNVFLNETCKDAMNITDFIDSIKLQLSDLEKVGEVGYIEGISHIILKNLNALDVTERPIHCTDKKRETMYIKDEDKWEKEDDNKTRLHKMVRKVSNKNINLISEFKELYPDWRKSTSKVSDQFNKIIIESMGGAGDNDFEKEEKIIKKVAKQVFIDKIST